MTTASQPSAAKRPYIGGQAVIEGVMMRSPKSFAVVVRRQSGDLVVRERKMRDQRKGIVAWPFVRGVMTLVESLRLGSQALRFSSDIYERDMEQAEAEKKKKPPSAAMSNLLKALSVNALALTAMDGEAPAEGSERSRNPMMTVALVFAVVLFVALPQIVAAVSSRLLHMDLDIRSPGFQALTGLFKLILVIGYMVVIRRVAEIRRVFQFHGAEHKAIAAYESGAGLTVEAARKRSRLHPRCGTTFLVLVVMVSILVFTGVGPLLPQIPLGGKVAENVVFFFMKLPFLPVIAAITYELQRLSARYCLTGPLRVLLYPGFAVQMITTIEPDDSQLQVALASMKATLWREDADDGNVEAAPSDRTFSSFADLMVDPGYTKVSPSQPTEQHATA